MVAEYIVRDWMLLEDDARITDTLIKEIELELDKAFNDGMKAAVVLSQSIEAAALERAAQRIEADDEDYMMRNEVAAIIRSLKGQP